MARPAGKSAIFFIFITILLNMIGFGVIMPVMPQLIMEVTGEGVAHAAKWGGYLSVVYAIMQFFMMPVIGGLSDRFGRRPVLLISLAAYSFDFLIMAIAPTIGMILVARMLAGAFAATFSTANAYIADVTPPEKRASNFGLIGAAFGVGFIIGPGIGGFLGEHFGPRAPFYFVAATGAVNFVFGFFAMPETLKPENRRAFDWRRANALGNFKQFAQYPIMLPIAAVLFFAQLAHWTYPSIWSYYAIEKFSWSEAMIGASLMYMGLTAGLVQGGLTRVAIPKLGERKAAIIGMSATAIGYLCFALANHGWMIFAILTFTAIGGLAQPSLQGIMSRTIPPNAQGELQGAIAALNSLTMVFSPWIMTQLFSAFSSPGEPFTLFSVTILPDGAPFYFPGAPLVFAFILEILALTLLFQAFKRIQRPRKEEGEEEETPPAEQPAAPV
ncbi:TCR/Tet family MFS transporter [Hyphococcus luteus]|uniref:Tetracycline resistance MFS efflux pump n=1 Tax=Hyphococcus luteus TaxID=2058213 RepID=A0A2S7K918_9PROT|nr:TCR/Tet family MFS transporter [Marinicaulis flavus]PQA88992.1 tetracycline resistance MFS efflux pump [Marinicaulis flavus]